MEQQVEIVEERVTERHKLPGLEFIMRARGIKRQKLANDLGVEPRRIGAVIRLISRAEPWEIEKLKTLLDVTLAQLISVPEGATLPARKSLAKTAATVDEQTLTVLQAATPQMQKTLTLNLPDSTQFQITTTATMTADLLERMAQAMLILAKQTA